MPAPTDRNALIALAKGWHRVSYDDERLKDAQGEFLYFYWISSSGVMQAELPDYVGTLKGVAGMMHELKDWNLKPCGSGWLYWRTVPEKTHFVPQNDPGRCVGEVWLSEIGKEAPDAS